MSDQKKTVDNAQEHLSVRERAELANEEKEQRRWRTYGIIAAVVAVLIAALLFWDNGFIQRSSTALTVGKRNYTAADVDYYYYNQYNSLYSYASFYGLDTSKSLRDQEYEEGKSWYDFLRDTAKENLQRSSLLAQEGEAEGYTISEDGQKNIDENLQYVKDQAKENDVSVSFFLRRMYGRFMNWSHFQKMVTESCYATDYEEHKRDSFEVTDQEVNQYYTDHKAEVDTFDYTAYKVSVETETDEEGNEIAATQEQIDKAKADAEQLQAALQAGDQAQIDTLVSDLGASDYSGVNTGLLIDETLLTWLGDESRKNGDVGLVEDSHTHTHEAEETEEADASASAEGSASAETSAPAEAQETHIDGYYAVRLNSRTLDEYKAGNVLTVAIPAEEIAAQTASEGDSSTEAEATEDAAAPTYDMDGAKAAADAFVSQWQAKGGTEDALRELTQNADEAEDKEAGEAEDKEAGEAEDKEAGEAETSAAGADESAPTYVLTEYESLDKSASALDSSVMDWIYNEQRNAGDYTVVEDAASNRYLMVYFTGYDEEPFWKTSAKDTLQGEKFDEWYKGAESSYEAKETWFYSQVG